VLQFNITQNSPFYQTGTANFEDYQCEFLFLSFDEVILKVSLKGIFKTEHTTEKGR
jgi:hypothetical protein